MRQTRKRIHPLCCLTRKKPLRRACQSHERPLSCLTALCQRMIPASITWGSCALVDMTTTAQDRVYCAKPITFVLRVIASARKHAVRPSSRARTLSPREAYLRRILHAVEGAESNRLKIKNRMVMNRGKRNPRRACNISNLSKRGYLEAG
jgi:hypothetical protein